MAAIMKIEKRPIGEFKINLSIRTGYFEVEYPKNLPEDVAKRLGNSVSHKVKALLTLDDAKAEVDRIAEEYFHNEIFIRKVIVIILKTSESDYVTGNRFGGLADADKKILGTFGCTEKDDLLHNCEGFQLEWHIAEEYKFTRDLRYKIIESNTHNGGNNPRHKRIDIMPQLMFGHYRMFEYREDLHNFLKDMDASISSMIKKMVDYFDNDPVKFIQNFEKNQLKLNSSNT